MDYAMSYELCEGHSLDTHLHNSRFPVIYLVYLNDFPLSIMVFFLGFHYYANSKSITKARLFSIQIAHFTFININLSK